MREVDNDDDYNSNEAEDYGDDDEDGVVGGGGGGGVFVARLTIDDVCNGMVDASMQWLSERGGVPSNVLLQHYISLEGRQCLTAFALTNASQAMAGWSVGVEMLFFHTQSVTISLIHSFTHSLIHSLTHPHPPTHSLTHSLTQ